MELYSALSLANVGLLTWKTAWTSALDLVHSRATRVASMTISAQAASSTAVILISHSLIFWLAGAGAGAAFGAGAGVGLGSAALGAAGGVLGAAVVKGAGKALNPVVSAAEQKLTDLGVKLTPGQLMGETARDVEAFATNLLGVGPKISAAKERAVMSFNKGVINKTLDKIGDKLPESATGRDAILYAADQVSNA